MARYLGREGKDAIFERVQFTGAQDAHIPRFTAAESELLVASQVRVQMAEHSCRLHFNWRHFSNRLHVQVVLGQLIADVVVLGQNDHLDDNVGLLLGAQTPIQRIQFTNGQESLEINVIEFN